MDLVCEALTQLSFQMFESVGNGSIKNLEDYLMGNAQEQLKSMASFRTYVKEYNTFKQT